MKYKKYLPIIIALLFIAGVANAQSVTFWKYLNGDVLPVIGTWGLRFDGEIKPDGATCSNGQILKKTGTDDWDCAADDSGSSDPFTHTTNYNQTVSATNTPIWHQAGLMASSTSYLVNASSTMQTITDAFWLPFHTAAILLTDAAGKIAEYTGTTCTNQFVRALSALGVATCESVNLASDVTGDLPFANLTQVAANSVLGNPTGSTGDAQSIATTTWNVGVLNALTSMGNGTSTFSGAVQIGSTAGDNAFLMTAGRNYGTGASTGGMVSLSNTNNTSAALNVYTNAGAGQSSLGLVFMKQDNALGDGTILRMDNDGVDNSLVINHNNTTTTLAPIDITNAGLTPGIQITATNASNSQGAVRIDSATPEIEMSEDDCPEGRGNCDAEWRLNNEIAQINSRNNADDSFEKGFGFSSTRQGGALQLVRPNASGDAEYGLFNSRIGIIGINTATTTNYLSISSATDGGGYEGTPLDDILVIPGSSGNLGIGTSSPSQKLTVHGAGSALQTLNCTVAGGSCWTQFSEKSVIRGYLGYSSVGGLATGITAGDMVLRTGAAFHVAGGSTPRLTVLNAGNVGIGTSTPYSKLSVVGETVAQNFTATSTTATSVFSGILQVLTRFITVIAAAFTPTTEGEIGIDTTSNQFKYYSNSAVRVLGNGNLYPAFTYATSTAWTGTTTIPIGTAYVGETWNGVQCFTDVGTLNVVFDDGTNKMNLFNASTTVGTVTLGTNNTFTASEKRYVDIGTPASSPTKISCTVSKSLTAD